MENISDEKIYFNVNYVHSTVDGEDITNTILFNDPLDYQTIFRNIEAGEDAKGFIVWEVPDDWKQFAFVYDGWQPSNGLSLSTTFTPKDLKKPKKYLPPVQ